MSVIFDWSGKLLEWLGSLLGMSYKAISVPLFVITMSIQHRSIRLRATLMGLRTLKLTNTQ